MKSSKKVLVISDLSGVGRCSLGVIMPVLSVMGYQVYPVPTGVLSSHTGGFENIATCPLEGYMQKALEQYKALDLQVDFIYTGYISSPEQGDICLEYIKAFPKAVVLVDPVMGDDGKAYKAITPEIQGKIKELVESADIITPNLTEVGILLDKPYSEQMSLEDYKIALTELSGLGPSKGIITGAKLDKENLTNLLYDKDDGLFWAVGDKKIPQRYPGTGDIFASALIGGTMKYNSVPKGLELATAFISHVIRYSYNLGVEPKYGVELEACLDWFYKEKEIKNKIKNIGDINE